MDRCVLDVWMHEHPVRRAGAAFFMEKKTVMFGNFKSLSLINELRCTFSCSPDHGGSLSFPKSHQYSPIPSKLLLSPVSCLGRTASHPAVPVSLSFLLSTLARCFSSSLSHHALGFM